MGTAEHAEITENTKSVQGTNPMCTAGATALIPYILPRMDTDERKLNHVQSGDACLRWCE